MSNRSQADAEFAVMNTAGYKEMDLSCFCNYSGKPELNQEGGAGWDPLGNGFADYWNPGAS